MNARDGCPLRFPVHALLGVGILGVGLLGCGMGKGPTPAEAFDVLITGARIVDGAGNPWVRGDVGLRGDRIAAVGDLTGHAAARTIDAADRVVSPGFIDMMGQSSLVLVTDPPSAESKLRQGITTYLSGEGGSAAPQSDETQPRGPVVDGEELRWRRYSEYFAHLERIGIPINVVHDVGLTQVRRVVLGDGDVQPTPEQLEEMKALVREAMEDGAVGASTSLIYPPAVYATTEELVELTRVAGEYGGTYFTHMRNESHSVLEAIREAIEIGVGAGTPVHIYHLKAAGRENWPLMAEALALIDSARVAGIDVTADIYPYIRNGIGLGSFLHPRHYAEGTAPFLEMLSDPEVRAELRREVETTSDWENWYRHVGMEWENVLIVSAPDEVDARVINLSISEAAEVLGADAWDAFFDLVQAGGVSVNPAEHERGAEVAGAPGRVRDDRYGCFAREPGHDGEFASARVRGLPAGHRQVRERGRDPQPRGRGAAHDLARRPSVGTGGSGPHRAGDGGGPHPVRPG